MGNDDDGDGDDDDDVYDNDNDDDYNHDDDDDDDDDAGQFMNKLRNDFKSAVLNPVFKNAFLSLP